MPRYDRFAALLIDDSYDSPWNKGKGRFGVFDYDKKRWIKKGLDRQEAKQLAARKNAAIRQKETREKDLKDKWGVKRGKGNGRSSRVEKLR